MATGTVDRDRGTTTIRALKELTQGGDEVGVRAGTHTLLSPPLHRGDDLGIQADTSVGDEPAIASATDADVSPRAVAQSVKDQAYGFDSIQGNAERPREHVGAATGNDAQQWNPVTSSAVQHAVDDLVDDAVTTKRDDNINAFVTSHPAQLESVTPIAGELDSEIQLGLQGVDENVCNARRGGGRPRIDDEKAAHPRSLPRRSGPTRV